MWPDRQVAEIGRFLGVRSTRRVRVSQRLPTVLPIGLEFNDAFSFGELIVGLVTLGLAGATVSLAFSTRKSAKAAEEAVERAEEPYVVATRIPRGGDLRPGVMAGEIRRWNDNLQLRLWNIGSGPAIVREVHLRSHERQDGSDVILAEGLPAHLPIAAGKHEDVSDLSALRWRNQRTGVLQIDYDHSNGHRYVTESEVTIKDDIVRCLTYPRRMAERSNGARPPWTDRPWSK
jgi:hypothetical protein